MGPGFVILFWLFLAAIFAVLWASSFGMFVVGWRKNKTWLAVLGAVPLLGLTAIALLLAALFGAGVIAGSNPRSVYTATFGQKPTSDVKNLQSKTWAFADEGHTFLQFQASYQTFQRIRRKELPQVSFDEYRQTLLAQPGRTPKWWTVPTASTTDVYLLNSEFGKGKGFATETTLMTYDTNTSTVQYYLLGID